jgi:tRNA threonylcarbamoyladenosine biosynthesis protein TsaE
MANAELTIVLSNEKTQHAFGGELGKICSCKNCVIYLKGELGAGKTTLARGFLHGLGFLGKVKSPTYTLVETYEFNAEQVLHIDLYRINSSNEVNDLGLQEKSGPKTQIYLIEWPEKAMKELPPPDITCNITPIENKRCCVLSAQTLQGKDIVLAMKKNWGNKSACKKNHEGKSF